MVLVVLIGVLTAFLTVFQSADLMPYISVKGYIAAFSPDIHSVFTVLITGTDPTDMMNMIPLNVNMMCTRIAVEPACRIIPDFKIFNPDKRAVPIE